MEERWDRADLPHRGWELLHVEDGLEANHTCEMCGKKDIRYLHALEHPEGHALDPVGSVCAQKMVRGYQGKAQRRLIAKGRSWDARLARWLDPARWGPSARGNPWRNYYTNRPGHVVLFRRAGGFWWARLNGRLSNHGLPTFEAAAKAVFCHLWPRPYRYSI